MLDFLILKLVLELIKIIKVRENGFIAKKMIYVILKIQNSSLVGKNPLLYKISNMEALDIDEFLDFEIAEFLYKKYYSNN